VELPPFSRPVVLEAPMGRWDMARGCYCARVVGEDCGIIPARLWTQPVRQLSLPEPVLDVAGVSSSATGASFTVRAETFAHAVHFGLDDGITASDEYFDLLPGEERRIELSGAMTGRRIAPQAVTGDWQRDR
jgi:beta-mannosidase